MFKKLKENKKGFTLVELIVVLVILAILAALLVPALTGYIDKAKRKSIVAETRQVVMAAQTVADEAYGKAEAGATIDLSTKYTEIQTLAEVKGTITAITVAAKDDADGITIGTIKSVTYTSGDGKYTCTYSNPATANATDGSYNVVAN